MAPEKIQDFLHRRPFQPFRLFLSDGSSYDIRHPEMALLTRREVYVGLPEPDETLPERSVICDLLHITRIQPIAESGTKQRRGRSNGK